MSSHGALDAKQPAVGQPVVAPRRSRGRARALGFAVALAAIAAVALAVVLIGGGAKHRSVGGHVVVASGAPQTAASPNHRTRFVAQVPDPEAARSFPEAPGTRHALAITPSSAASGVSPGAPSDAEIARELKQMQHAQAAAAAQASRAASAGSAGPPTLSFSGTSLGGNGAAPIPANVPDVIARVIAGGNAIADFPYRFGGGHASFVDNAYDCSASVSYALAAGGLIGAPVVSGQLEQWGAAGPGRWLTVYAKSGHTFMYVNGLRFDTSGRNGPLASRWQTGARPTDGFVVRHWPGL